MKPKLVFKNKELKSLYRGKHKYYVTKSWTYGVSYIKCMINNYDFRLQDYMFLNNFYESIKDDIKHEFVDKLNAPTINHDWHNRDYEVAKYKSGQRISVGTYINFLRMKFPTKIVKFDAELKAAISDRIINYTVLNKSSNWFSKDALMGGSRYAVYEENATIIFDTEESLDAHVENCKSVIEQIRKEKHLSLNIRNGTTVTSGKIDKNVDVDLCKQVSKDNRNRNKGFMNIIKTAEPAPHPNIHQTIRISFKSVEDAASAIERVMDYAKDENAIIEQSKIALSYYDMLKRGSYSSWRSIILTVHLTKEQDMSFLPMYIDNSIINSIKTTEYVTSSPL